MNFVLEIMWKLMVSSAFIGNKYVIISIAHKARLNLAWIEEFTFFSGAAAVCGGFGTPIISRLCGATKILSTQSSDEKSSASIYGKSRLK